MKAFYLNILRKSIFEGIDIKNKGDRLIITVSHPKLLDEHQIEIMLANGNAISIIDVPVKYIVHQIMKRELILMRKQLHKLENIRWWLTIIPSVIIAIWLVKNL